MGKQRRTRILGQVDEIAQLIHVPPEAIKVETSGVLTTPEQMDKLLVLARKKGNSAKQRFNALQS